MERKALLIAGLSALLGVALLRLYMHRFEREATGGPPTRVLVLTKDAPLGTIIGRELLGQRDLPQAFLESRHIAAREQEEILGAKLAVAGRAGETLLLTDLASMREPMRQLSALVPEGMRAFTLTARDGAFDTLLAPGDRVDVLLALPARGGLDAHAAEALVAQNVLVLAVGDDLGGSEQAPKRRVGRADQVTLSLSPLDSIRVVQAERAGPLRLIVRNPDDLATTDLAPIPGTANEPGSRQR